MSMSPLVTGDVRRYLELGVVDGGRAKQATEAFERRPARLRSKALHESIERVADRIEDAVGQFREVIAKGQTVVSRRAS
jgi:hypothetical protein